VLKAPLLCWEKKMKTAVLVVSFGTMQEAAWDKTIGLMEEEIRQEWQGRCDVFTAYTSRRVVEYWRAQERSLLDEEEAFVLLRNLGYEAVVALPTHLAAGQEFTKLKQKAEQYEACFKRLILGVPILEKAVYRERLAKALKDEIIVGEQEALVLMAHGVRKGDQQVYHQLQRVLNADGKERVIVVAMENKELEPMEGVTVHNLVLAPLLLTAGKHVTQDMCGAGTGSWQGFLESKGYAVRTVKKGLAEYPKVREVYKQQLRELCTSI